MGKQVGNAVVGLLLLATFVTGVVGWGLNIVALAHADFSRVTGLLVLRCLGVIMPPLGAVLGYC